MKYWKRYIEFIIEDRHYSQPFELSFDIDFPEKGAASARARIYNPSEETINSVMPSEKENKTITVDAGYEDDHGVCFNGEIYGAEVSTSGLDRILEMKIKDSTRIISEKRISQTWKAGVTASKIINDIVNASGIYSGKIIPGKDKTYNRGISFNDRLKRVLDFMARETDSQFFFRYGRIYFMPWEYPGDNTGLILSAETGLLGKPELKNPKKNLWTIKSLFNYRIGNGDMITVSSDYAGKLTGDNIGMFRIMSGRHSFSGSSASTEMEAMRI